MVRQSAHISVQAEDVPVAQRNKHITVDTEHMMDRKNIQKYLIFGVIVIGRRKCIVDQIPV